MALWWITGILPLAITALLPILLFPLLNIASIRETTAPFANPVIFLFMGGFILSLAMQRWNLHRRLALHLLYRMKGTTWRIIWGFAGTTALLSMWISNTATVLMLLPLALSVIEWHASTASPLSETFPKVLLLSIAYAASIGGMATLIGTPPNALLASFMLEEYQVEISFAQWFLFAFPLVIVALPLALFILTRISFRLPDAPVGKELAVIAEELRQLGPLTSQERWVASIFTAVALLWMVRPLLGIQGLTDTGIAIGGALTLFLVPVDLKKREFLMNWEWMRKLPWDVLILFGGGLSLASAIQHTGLAQWLGEQAMTLTQWPFPLILLLITALIVLLTELTSNTATAAAFLPIAASIAVGLQYHPLMLSVPVALGSSCAFMLPVATPPNAIVYGSNLLRIQDMIKAGLWLNLLFIGLITLYTLWMLPLIFPIKP